MATDTFTVTLFDVPPDVTGTITPGGRPVVLTTAVPGQNAKLAFDGVAGQKVSLAATGTAGLVGEVPMRLNTLQLVVESHNARSQALEV